MSIIKKNLLDIVRLLLSCGRSKEKNERGENMMERKNLIQVMHATLTNDERMTSSRSRILTRLLTCPQIMDAHARRIILMRKRENFFRFVSNVYIN